MKERRECKRRIGYVSVEKCDKTNNTIMLQYFACTWLLWTLQVLAALQNKRSQQPSIL